MKHTVRTVVAVSVLLSLTPVARADEAGGGGDRCAEVTPPAYLDDYEFQLGDGCEQLATALADYFFDSVEELFPGAASEGARELATRPAGASLYSTSFESLEAVPSVLPVVRSGLSVGPLVVPAEGSDDAGETATAYALTFAGAIGNAEPDSSGSTTRQWSRRGDVSLLAAVRQEDAALFAGARVRYGVFAGARAADAAIAAFLADQDEQQALVDALRQHGALAVAVLEYLNSAADVSSAVDSLEASAGAGWSAVLGSLDDDIEADLPKTVEAAFRAVERLNQDLVGSHIGLDLRLDIGQGDLIGRPEFDDMLGLFAGVGGALRPAKMRELGAVFSVGLGHACEIDNGGSEPPAAVDGEAPPNWAFIGTAGVDYRTRLNMMEESSPVSVQLAAQLEEGVDENTRNASLRASVRVPIPFAAVTRIASDGAPAASEGSAPTLAIGVDVPFYGGGSTTAIVMLDTVSLWER